MHRACFQFTNSISIYTAFVFNTWKLSFFLCSPQNRIVASNTPLCSSLYSSRLIVSMWMSRDKTKPTVKLFNVPKLICVFRVVFKACVEYLHNLAKFTKIRVCGSAKTTKNLDSRTSFVSLSPLISSRPRPANFSLFFGWFLINQTSICAPK